MKKLRYAPMAVVIALGVGAFLTAQRFDVIRGPWSKDRMSMTADGAPSVDTYSAQIAANPQDYMPYYRRGVYLQKQRRYDAALADFNTAVQLSPIPLSLEVLGIRAGDTRLPEARTLNLVVLVRMARAGVLQQMNRPEEALADFDQALAFDARKIDIVYQRAMLRLMTRRYDEAIADFDTVLNRGVDADSRFGRGLAKYLKADWAGAIVDFQDAARTMPSNEFYLVWLAKAHLRGGIDLPAQQFAALGDNSGARRVIEAFMSDYNPAQFMAGVRAGAAYSDRHAHDHQCEASLFMGEWLVIRKQGKGAREMFADAEASCRPLSVERAIASAELLRLEPQ